MDIVFIIIGLCMLAFGRSLFWLFVGAAGFLAGMQAAAILFPGEPFWVVILVAMAAGLLGVVLAIVMHRVAFALAGFFGAFYLVLVLTQSMSADLSMGLSLAAGVLGAIAAALLMDRAIMVISSLVGAGAVVVGLSLEETLEGTVLFVVLAAAGLLFQSLVFRRRVSF